MTFQLNRTFATCLALAVTLVPVKLVCAQTETQRSDTVRSADPDKKPCVLLYNDNVLFGKATQVGDDVIVERGEGNQIRLPRQDVACWANSIRNLYRFRVDRRQKGDVSAHVKDARWCIRYDLYDLAEVEVAEVLMLDRDNPDAIRMQAQLLRIQSPPTYRTPTTIVQPVSHEVVTDDLAGVDQPTLTRFAGSVQPMLINRCGHCHSHTSDRSWQLIKPSAGARASARMTRENLAAALQFVKPQSLESSELWTKAISAHGGAAAPLDVRRGKAIKTLRDWLIAVRATTPVPARDDNDRADTATVDQGASHASRPDAAIAARPIDPERSFETWLNDRSVQNETPARLPNVANPFDPELFNRRYHPQ